MERTIADLRPGSIHNCNTLTQDPGQVLFAIDKAPQMVVKPEAGIIKDSALMNSPHVKYHRERKAHIE